MNLLSSFIVLFALAWLVRALIGARELTWPRILLATAVGWAVGDFIALTMVTDLENVADVDYDQIAAIAFPFRLIAAMGAIVVLELISSSRHRRSQRRRPIRAVRNLGRVLVRSIRVLAITVRHGLAPLLGFRGGDDTNTRDTEDLARRIRLALEDAGGMFVKLGQLLATRPDLLPPTALAQLGRLHADAAPLDRETVEELIAAEVDAPLDEVFERIEWEPIGSASIAQAHGARLKNGQEVVIKIQRPGLADQVDVDLTIVMWMARLAARRTTWGAAYEVDVLAGEFADSLRDELDFRIEARNAIESMVSLEPGVAIPKIFDNLTTPRLLVMERLRGVPLSKIVQPIDVEVARHLADALCASQVTAMLQGDRFHGDPHPGNVMVMEQGGVGLIDFGITGRLDAFERASVLQMLVALRFEQPTLLYEAMVSMGAVGPTHDPNAIERAFAQFMTAHLGSGLPTPEALTDLMRLINELHLHLPASTSTMFRALATLAGTLEQLSPGYPIIEVVANLGGSEFKERIAPDSMRDFVQQEFARLAPLVSRAPRHLDRLATLAEHGRLTTRVRLFTEPDDVRVLQRLANLFVLTALSIGVGAVSVMMLGTEGGPILEAADTPFLEILGWVGLTLAVILLLRVLLSVLRTE